MFMSVPPAPGSYCKCLWGSSCWHLLFTACITASVPTWRILSSILWLKRRCMISALFHRTWFSNKYIKISRKKKTQGHRVAQVDTVHTVGFHHSRRSSIFYNELQANLPIFTPDRSIVFIIMYSDNPSLCSRERYYLYLPRLFNIWTFSKKIVINKRLSMPLLEETQKHKRPTENNLPIVYTPEYYSWSTISMVNP